MKTVKIVCYKISNRLKLSTLASYFDVHSDVKNLNFILIKDKAISSIIKVQSNSKFIYMYEYGCIVFVDFSSDEIYSTLEYLENIIGFIDYKLISHFNENLVLTIDNGQMLTKINDFPCEFEYNGDILSIACGLISKSTVLFTAETEISTVLDQAENIVNYLQKAKLRIKTRDFVSSISHMARFQYNTIKSLGLFSSTLAFKRNLNIRRFYSILYYYYEIDDRANIIESKIDQINRLISSYTTLSYNRQEMRLLVFECILLAMFFLPHLMD